MKLYATILLITLSGCTYNVTTQQADSLECEDIYGDSESILAVPLHEYVAEQRPAATSRLVEAMAGTPKQWVLANAKKDPDSVDMLLRLFAENCGIWHQATSSSAHDASFEALRTMMDRRGLE